MPRITQITIAGIHPTGAVQFIRDESLQGFGIKVTPRGKASYFVEKRVKQGRVVRKVIGSVELLSLDEARNEAREMLLQLHRGVDVGRLPPPSPPVENSLAAVFERYKLTRVNLAETTKQKYEQALRNCFPDWLPLNVETITPEMVAARYGKLREQGKSDAYIKVALRTLKAILNSSGLTVNPVKAFMAQSGVTTASTSRSRFLRSHEIQRLMEVTRERDGAPNLFGELLLFYLLTGCRLNEALSLKKADYNATDGTLTFRNTKNGRDHRIPTDGWIKSILERAVEASQTDKIFDYTPSTFRTKFDKAREYLSFGETWTIHDLRRTFAEHCELAGVDVGNIATALNHSPVGVTQRHYARGELAKLETLRGVYDKLQRQYRGYLYDVTDQRINDPLDYQLES